MTGVRELCRLAVRDAGAFVQWVRANRGELDRAEVRMVLRRGTAAFVGAIARGDVAPEPTRMARLRRCVSCPAKTGVSGRGHYAEPVLYCGEPFTEDPKGPDGGGPVCGCDIEAKTLVGSEACPRGKWGPVSVTVHGLNKPS